MSSQADAVIKIRKEWEALTSLHEKDANTSSLLHTTVENIRKGNIQEAEKTWNKFIATDTGRTVRKALFSDLIETYAARGTSVFEEKGPSNLADENKDNQQNKQADKEKKDPLYSAASPIPRSAKDLIEQITTEKRKDEDKKTTERIEKEKKLLIRKPAETKDKLFNESIKKLNKELLYNIKFKKKIPANLLSRSIKRTVVEHYVDQQGDEYRLCEKNVFDNWCKRYGTADKKDSEFRSDVDNTFLLEKRPDLLPLTKELEHKKDEARPAFNADFFVKHILSPVINNFLYQDLDKEKQTNEKKQINRRKGLNLKQYPRRYFINKADKRRIIQFLVLIFSVKLNTYKNQIAGLAPVLIGHESFLEVPGQTPLGSSSFYKPTSSQYSSSSDYYPSEEGNRSPSYWQGPYNRQSGGLVNRANNLFSRARNIGRPLPRASTNLASKSLSRKAARNILRGMRFLSPVANPATMVIILVSLLVLFFLIQGTIGPGGISDELTTTAGSNISITKTAIDDDGKINAEENISFKIDVNYSNVTGPIIITDPIPQNAQYVSCENCTVEGDINGNLVAKWTINPNSTQTTSSSNPENSETTQQASSFNQERFTGYGFPAPDNSITMDTTSLERWNKVMPQAVLASEKTGVDIGILGWWAWKESGGLDYCFENCVDGTNTVNNSCYCSLNADDECLWQVGIFGNHPQYTIGYLPSAMNEMHPGLTPQQVGQAVIDQSKNRCLNNRAITNPSIFPNYGLEEIIEGATNDKSANNKEMKLLVATLYKDDGIGAYLLAKHFLDVGLNDSLATRMLDWDKDHKGVQEGNYYNSLKVINHIKAIHDAGTSGTAGSTYSGSSSFTITLKPKNGVNDTYIINQTFANNAKSNCSYVAVGSPQEEVVLPTSCKDGGLDQSNIVSGAVSKCSGKIVSFGVEKKLLPFADQCPGSRGCGRKISCFTPTKIVLHTTWGGGDVGNLYEYFASGSGGRGVGTQFGIGKDGRVIQMAETLSDKVEITAGIANYNSQAISIELCHSSNYSSKNEVPPAQYNAAVSLVKALMSQYNIPVGSLEYTWISPSNARNPNAGPGIYGHYQLNPITKTDPGSGFMRDFRESLRQMN